MMDRGQDDRFGGPVGPSPAPGRGVARAWVSRLREPDFRAVLLVWAFCCLGQAMLIRSHGSSLPWCDEWCLVAPAAGVEPLSISWLLTPANEHRAPLTRLAMYVLGEVGSLDMQVMHYVGLGSMAVGALALVATARDLRGKSSLGDAFFPLVILNPWHFETVVIYGYAYAIATGLLCVAIRGAATQRPLGSTRSLLAYLGLTLAVCLSAGPAGNFWAVGLCGVVVAGMARRASTAWKATGLIGSTVVAATAGAMILGIPECPWHDSFRSESVAEAATVALKASLGWLGRPPLQALWPWASAAILVPIALIGVGLGRDLVRIASGKAKFDDPGRWGLAAFLGSTLLVSCAIGYGRGRVPSYWDSRYMALTQPIGIAAYLLMVRMRIAPAVPQAMAILAAVCVGWSWPETIQTTRGYHERRLEAERVLREGTMPISVAAEEFTETLGIPRSYSYQMVGRFLLMREHDLSIYRGRARSFHGIPIPQPLAWEAESLVPAGGPLRVDEDPVAVGGAAALAEGPGTANLELEVPDAGSYRLCIRLRSEGDARKIALSMDGAPPVELPIEAGAGFLPVVVETPFALDPGRHTLAIECPAAGLRLDFIELVPQPEPMEPGAFAARLRARQLR
ncbi:carbohydrate-binding protein [Tautonia plasticadhaerens]|uniref:Glycosyltransferase RgtA/B/C/D-like domain-containing protein n=1 Tax=Tautonia plasticadhaerens TaxID=2527974 RepID=A0A518HAU2_9BACT|nr:hypothetical protein [Tautonia plasticadhaerens]QDV37972.1 hypothetical protein ElP_59190 [Tautonia plasticadhaerens]